MYNNLQYVHNVKLLTRLGKELHSIGRSEIYIVYLMEYLLKRYSF